jgi:hypothetical protein
LNILETNFVGVRSNLSFFSNIYHPFDGFLGFVRLAVHGYVTFRRVLLQNWFFFWVIAGVLISFYFYLAFFGINFGDLVHHVVTHQRILFSAALHIGSFSLSRLRLGLPRHFFKSFLVLLSFYPFSTSFNPIPVISSAWS